MQDTSPPHNGLPRNELSDTDGPENNASRLSLSRAALPHIVLIGFMGTGKSTVGRIAAARLGMPFTDIDALIEATLGMGIAALFAERGEPAFRELERETISRMLGESPGLIATGGGAPLDPITSAALRENSFVILLTASPAVILRRIGNPASRPLLAGPDPAATIARLLMDRMAIYEGLADAVIDTGRRTPSAAANEVVRTARSLAHAIKRDIS